MVLVLMNVVKVIDGPPDGFNREMVYLIASVVRDCEFGGGGCGHVS